MELTAYHRWLLQHCKGDVSCIALQLAHDTAEQNPQAFDVLALTGDVKYSRATFFKAAKLIIKANEKAVHA
jgi:hypothetical protein